MNALRFALLIAPTIAWLGPAVAASLPPPGAASCSGCHAVREPASSAIPKIYGRNADEIVAAMTAFRDGSRPSTVMNRIAKGFSDDELRPIAAWLATQQ
jgi:sulfide dehydrogenase cytochrome subunit